MINGEALEEGEIVLAPLGEQIGNAQAAQTKIKEGHYSFSPSAGLSPGKFRVAVTALRETGERVPIAEGSRETRPVETQFIPARYNVRSTLTADISGERDNLDFNLELDASR